MNKIPDSVLAVLTHQWQTSVWLFERRFAINSSKPSSYIVHVGHEVEYDLDFPLSHAEALTLVEAGVFGSQAKVTDTGNLKINEHAWHALVDFFAEVYVAWKKYQSRLRAISGTGG